MLRSPAAAIKNITEIMKRPLTKEERWKVASKKWGVLDFGSFETAIRQFTYQKFGARPNWWNEDATFSLCACPVGVETACTAFWSRKKILVGEMEARPTDSHVPVEDGKAVRVFNGFKDFTLTGTDGDVYFVKV